jgi:hypothetical protein
MCLSITYNKVHIGKNLSDAYTIQNGLKKGDALLPLLFNFALVCAIMEAKDNSEKTKYKGVSKSFWTS